MAKKTKDIQYYEGVGRRREAIARVRLHILTKEKEITVAGQKVAKGQILVNGKPLEVFAVNDYDKVRILKPLRLTESDARFAITVKTVGGGFNGQVEAIRHGISRALTLVDKEEYKPLLKKEGLLTRDPRARQRRMVGKGGKSRRAKQSPKR
ncbi:MAG: 30S ribosomal protein S9 [Patescibacteria group bacterium]|nr:30S ribosomal protein S9 [Patescibacteria group bacterium]